MRMFRDWLGGFRMWRWGLGRGGGPMLGFLIRLSGRFRARRSRFWRG